VTGERREPRAYRSTTGSRRDRPRLQFWRVLCSHSCRADRWWADRRAVRDRQDWGGMGATEGSRQASARAGDADCLRAFLAANSSLQVHASRPAQSATGRRVEAHKHSAIAGPVGEERRGRVRGAGISGRRRQRWRVQPASSSRRREPRVELPRSAQGPVPTGPDRGGARARTLRNSSRLLASDCLSATACTWEGGSSPAARSARDSQRLQPARDRLVESRSVAPIPAPILTVSYSSSVRRHHGRARH